MYQFNYIKRYLKVMSNLKLLTNMQTLNSLKTIFNKKKFEIDTLKCGIYPKKNNSQLKTNPLHKKLDSNQIKDIKDLLDSL